MMLRRWPKLGLMQPYYKYGLWRCWLLVSLVLLHQISYGRMEEVLRLRGGGGGGQSAFGQARHPLQQLDEHETYSSSSNEIECPSFAENSACPCYKFEDGLFLECPSITGEALRSTLQLISAPIQSLSVYEFDRSVKSLTADLFASSSGSQFGASPQATGSSSSGNDVNIRHLQFSHSNLQQLKENSLNNLRAHLESLSIVNGKLTQVPTKALSGMKKLMVLDFELNEIGTVEEYAFYGLHLVKLNLKGNRLQRVPENALVGLEDSLAEVDFSENQLKQFPTAALKRLENLRSVRLSMNEINSLEQDDSYARFSSLVFLDLSLNNFVELYSDVFNPFPYLKTLSLYNNFIELVHRDSFVSLKELQSLDLSHNKIVFVDAEVFAANRKLHTVDLSHNHIHYVSGVFANLPLLREIFLSENNILELTDDCFSNSTSVKVIYLENNSIQRLDAESLVTLFNLEQLYLSGNHIPRIPAGFFESTSKLHSLSLDNNMLSELEGCLFRRLPNLREVRLNDNQLRLIREQLFAESSNLMELHLQNNALRVIERFAFKNCHQLQYINLQENALNEIDTIFSYSADGSTANHLQQPLTARGKLITTKTGVSEELPFGSLGSESSSASSSLLSIQLNSNSIKYLHGSSFQGQTDVQVIWLENNMLKSLDKMLFADLIHLERLYLRNNSLVSIEVGAFDSQRALKHLDLSVNRLSELNENLFRSMAELDELYLSDNELEKLTPNVFGALRRLRVLDLSYNKLGVLQSNVFQPNFSVSVINLKSCGLSRIEPNAFKGLQNLNELNLEENQLKSDDIKQIDASSLRTLRLSANNFTIIRENMLDRLPSLQTLALDRCAIRDLPYTLFSKNNNLVKLDLSSNLLRTLRRNIFVNLNVFKELRLYNNSFSDFPHVALSNVSTLELLSLSKNQLTSVDFFKLNGLPNLRHLDLRDNSISSLSGFNTITLPHLDMIDLSGNLLLALPENFFKHSISLQRIDLSCNRFSQIPNAALSESSLARLAWLNLTGNPLQRIHQSMSSDADLRRYPHLKEIHISQTNLTILTSKDFEIYPALQRLYLLQNRINRVSPGAFVALSNLQILDLSVNEIEILPKERLQGLRLLEILNISTNNIKDLDEFTEDLQKLRILDVSSNQLERLQKNTLRHLVALQELVLYGNRIVSISSDAFRSLRALRLLDLRKNYFEYVPLRALKPLETHLRQLRVEENPLVCSCDTQEPWEWLSDHRKWTLGYDNVRCEQPPEVQGKNLLTMEPQEFCDTPLILKIAIQDIQPYSVLVSWQSREHSGLHGYHVIFHSLDTVEDIRGRTLNRLANSAKLDRLSSNTRYLICVLGLGNWLSYHSDIHSLLNQSNQIQNQILNNQPGFMMDELDTSFSNTLLSLMMDTPTSRCTEVRTLDAIGPNPLAEVDGMSSQGIIHSILTRRLGLIVGCCLGIIVFIVLVSVLGYLKIKKQRLEAAKRQQQPMAPEFISYRHFSIPNDEHGRDGVAGAGGTNTFLHNNHHQNQQPPPGGDGHPSFISGAVLGTTTTHNGDVTDERIKVFIDS
ncbi:protein artichoke [Wyeomyia smithii]|uniref:protein artichoke n=1 Tax=Wyeomyia smithii TaxID=174621 RepID=UPI002467FEE5|nr:protein artichoke [Wyeomyia smithii]XP_055526400.1 protein artichoke [Wyeomyia smithii]XP_055526409.1 protein artichoke [Wyeomyia smithii]XP_055526417.1 protein artichoke [Wyeomyia smithii]